MDSFPPWVTRVRKDPLGPVGFNQLTAERFRWVEKMFGQEHLLEAGASVGTAGEHNAAEIPREVGSVYYAAGPTYSAHDFRYATGVTRNGVGDVSLNLDSDPYPNIYQLALQVQNCSESAINKPTSTGYVVVSTSEVRFYSYVLTSGLGAGNAWAAEEADFCVALHAPPLPVGANSTLGTSKHRGDFLTDDAADWNATVLADATIRDNFGQGHDATGSHDVREVAKGWGRIGVRSGGGAFDILETGTLNPIAGVTRPGIGIAEITFTTAFTLSAQPFVELDYARNNGGTEEQVFAGGTPRSFIFTDGGAVKLRVYTYEYDTGALTWARADCDFFIAVHGG